MKTHAMWVVVLVAAAGCSASGGDEDIVDSSGKLDSLSLVGSYANARAKVGELSLLELRQDGKYHRETAVECTRMPCNPRIEDGSYKLSRGNVTYIRFLETNGSLHDRYVYEQHGKQLKVRPYGEDTWQLMMLVEKTHIDSPFAGIYTQYQGEWKDGFVQELDLDDNGRFRMDVRGEIGCAMPGHSCPASWGDGPTGWTNFRGRWEERAGGVTLVPRNDVTGEESPPIALGLEIHGTSVTIDGHLGRTVLLGPLEARALLSGPHQVEEEELDGAWTAVKDRPADAHNDGVVSIFGSGLFSSNPAEKHVVTLDVETHEWVETYGNHRGRGVFRVAGDPAGGTLGVIVFRAGEEFAVLPMKKLERGTLVARDFYDQLDFEFQNP